MSYKSIHRTILRALFILSLCVMMVGVAQANDDLSNYKYTVYSDGTVGITKYTGSATTLTIPSTIKGGKVVLIGSKAFENCETLVKVTIPASVTDVGFSAFLDCDNLTEVVFEKGTKVIDDYAFQHCPELTKVTLPSSLTTIGTYAFWACEKLNDISLPASVTKIGNSAFNGCSSLTEITIPAKVSVVGFEAFANCTSLTSVTIKKGVTAISGGAFYSCSRLESISIPGSVTEIQDRAFLDCSSLAGVSIGRGLKTIGSFAFGNCSALKRIDIPDSVTSIKSYAFSNCSALSTFTLPASLTELGVGAFSGCRSIASTEIPYKVKTISENTFNGCDKLRTVTISEGVTKIENGAFANCTSLSSIDIPSTVTTIGDSAFDAVKTFTIWGYANTAAESYYKKFGTEKNIQFKINTYDMYVSESSVYIVVGATVTLHAKSISNETFTWSSNDTSIAEVSSKGVVKGKKQGVVNIYATNQSGQRARCAVYVLFKDVVGSGNSLDSDYVYYYSPVYWAANAGITTGYSDGTFGVGKECDRKSMAIFYWRTSGCPSPKGDARDYFKDLSAYGKSSATNQAIAWAYENGITKGYSDGGFHPAASITRKDSLIMFYRMVGKPNVTGVMSFKDCTKYAPTSDTYKAILWALECGITNGFSGNVFKPDDNCLREQIVTFIYRYIYA